MKNLKITFSIFIIILGVLAFNKVKAVEETTKITLTDSQILVGENQISTNAQEAISLSNNMDNGGSSNEAKEANIQVANIININRSGDYEFSGNLSDGQIAINSNEVVGNVTIILNNVNITCKNAPAIFVYNKSTNSNTCTVTIRTQSDSKNTITGGKIKQSVENWEDQSQLSYYVEKGYDDDRSYYERYKYDGAISSDISLNFEGEGLLTVNSSSKEGIETKRDITINSGNYVINSLDDGINACTDGESVITINGGTILVNILSEAEEGDAIDSNGSIIINNGTVYAFACENSQDNGLDSDNGTYINGGTVVSTSNMADEIDNSSKQAFMTLQFANTMEKNELVTITDTNKNLIVSFKADRGYRVLTISTPNMLNQDYYVYKGGEITGTEENGLYLDITSYSEGEKLLNSNNEKFTLTQTSHSFRNIAVQGEMVMQNANTNNQYVLIGLGIALLVFIIVTVIVMKKNKVDSKGKILMLVLGIFIGAIISVASCIIYYENNNDKNKEMDMRQDFNGKGLGNGEQMPNGRMQNDGGKMPNDNGRPEENQGGQPLEMPSGSI